MAFYNPVIRAQENLSRTVNRGLSGLGDRALDEQKFKLFEKQTLADLARRAKADVRADKRLELAQNADQRGDQAQQMAQTFQKHQIGMDTAADERAAQSAARASTLFGLQKKKSDIDIRTAAEALKDIELKNEPLTASGLSFYFLGFKPSRETTSDFLANGKMQQLMEATGGKVVNTKDGMRFVKANGQVATWRDMPMISALAKPILRSGRDPVLQTKQRIRELEKLGTKDLPPEEYERYVQAKKNVSDPGWQLDQYEKMNQADMRQAQLFASKGLSTRPFEINISRRDQKIASIQGGIAKQAEHTRNKELEKIKKGSDDGKSLTKLQNDAMKKVGEYLGYGTDLIQWTDENQQSYADALSVISQLSKSEKYKNDPAGLARAAVQGGEDPLGIRSEVKDLLFK